MHLDGGTSGGAAVNRTLDLLAALRSEIQNAADVDRAAILGQVAALLVQELATATRPIAGRIEQTKKDDADQLIDISAAAEMLGMSTTYLYRHAKEYGGQKHGRALRFSVRRIAAIMTRRSYN